MKRQIQKGILALAGRVPLVHRAATILAAQDAYRRLRDRVVDNGRGSRFDKAIRSDLVERFERIDREVPTGTSPSDGLFFAELVFNTQGQGPLVECGCYAGASSAKLSILAKLVRRELIICDSFEGLPVAAANDLRDHHCRQSDTWVTDWTAGRYSSGLEKVQSNIQNYGEIQSCRFVRGWFHETLVEANLPQQISFAFADVDLATSARDCFVALWPRLSEGGIYVTHDTAYIKVLQELYSPDLWQDKFKSTPPILFGAGYGLSDSSPHLGYMVKGKGLSSEYLKSLTVFR
jgi:O-methyltransferase